jgi:hypothetical protein
MLDWTRPPRAESISILLHLLHKISTTPPVSSSKKLAKYPGADAIAKRLR